MEFALQRSLIAYLILSGISITGKKEALEGNYRWLEEDIYPLKKGYKPEEPKNNHPASRVFQQKEVFNNGKTI